MYIEQTMHELPQLRGALPASVTHYFVDITTAIVNYRTANKCFTECPPAHRVKYSADLATENGFEVAAGWWWCEDAHEEQRHGPFASEAACLVHALTWQHLLVNGKLNGHLPYNKVQAPGFTAVVGACYNSAHAASE